MLELSQCLRASAYPLGALVQPYTQLDHVLLSKGGRNQQSAIAMGGKPECQCGLQSQYHAQIQVHFHQGGHCGCSRHVSEGKITWAQHVQGGG